MTLDTIRHLSEFSPAAFSERRVDIIGVGATGSRIALSLAKLGVTCLHAWDFDCVEAHNIPNQIYGLGDVGKPKVTALADMIRQQTGLEIVAHNARVDGSQPLGVVVFLTVDTMAARRAIWDGALRYKMSTKLMIETRMGSDNGRVYAINPCNPAQITGWESTLYTDAEAEVSACGASVSVGPTAELIAGLAVWQFLKWFQQQEGRDVSPEHELIFGLKPTTFINNQY